MSWPFMKPWDAVRGDRCSEAVRVHIPGNEAVVLYREDLVSSSHSLSLPLSSLIPDRVYSTENIVLARLQRVVFHYIVGHCLITSPPV